MIETTENNTKQAITLIKALTVQNKSIEQIVHELNSNEFRNAKGGLFDTDQVKEILKGIEPIVTVS